MPLCISKGVSLRAYVSGELGPLRALSAAAAKKLEAARVNVRVAPYWIRVAPSIYNDMRDMERLLEALS